MQSLTLTAIFLIASCALSTGATGQIAYKCGDTYSQLPCPGATVIDASDPRSKEQKEQSELDTARAARTAQALQQARLQQEKKDLAANTPAATPTGTGQAGAARPSQARPKKGNAPEFFTAQIPAEKKKKQPSKKSTGKKPRKKL